MLAASTLSLLATVTNIANMNGVVIRLALFFTLIIAPVSTFGPKMRPADRSEDYNRGYKANFTGDVDPSIIPPGTLDINGNIFDQSRVTATLKVTNGGPWGSWGKPSFCPEGSFAAGYDMKIQTDQKNADDTSLNGIRMVCKNPKGQAVGVISSTVGPWGIWVGRTFCNEPHRDSTDYLAAVCLQVEPNQDIFIDDTAANFVKFMCRGKCRQYELVKPLGHGFWGSWGRWSESCPLDSSICGIRTKVEEERKSLDETALNDVIFYCCE